MMSAQKASQSPALRPARVRDGFVALDACHQHLLDAADDLENLVASIETDGENPALRAMAAAIVKTLAAAAEHHADEERHVFPALLGRGDDALSKLVLRLQQDHGWLEEDWLELEPQVQAIATGYGSWDIDTLRAGTEVLAALLRDHIALEESIIYPEAQARLTVESRREMGREMAARHRKHRHADA
jgi:hemerythrin-like domain-containing protein